MTKGDLRKLYKQKRMALSRAECQKMDQLIFEYLLSLDWSDCRYLHVYLPFGKFNEPDTSLLIEWIRTNYPHIHLVLSRSDIQQGTMTNYLWDEHTELVMNTWGILEPIAGKMLSEDLIDMVLVPLLIADKKGNRVGYGKGFYDRFLAQCRSDVRTIGLSYFEPVDHIEPVDPWDIALQYCVCPSGLYVFE
ncbi:5-formyltetrahydrofolate cyclo-ligase [Parapedobacter sp. SGR-10]|uniref:5-formyltetrahydrofolate cyclo-ligase n=1 Tax=Parapedobacter sp. SGR-10 TaxID=2710879 RepID=UPI0013D08E7B|nr:5-formyltetrahydrofolate cyclo-ligase [Parapedobacter sp. SGR-10]NGF55998.1 5-formyltetrahydrofolate cyclo-ligase [Parapedobacter sp. SGR-10]